MSYLQPNLLQAFALARVNKEFVGIQVTNMPEKRQTFCIVETKAFNYFNSAVKALPKPNTRGSSNKVVARKGADVKPIVCERSSIDQKFEDWSARFMKTMQKVLVVASPPSDSQKIQQQQLNNN